MLDHLVLAEIFTRRNVPPEMFSRRNVKSMSELTLTYKAITSRKLKQICHFLHFFLSAKSYLFNISMVVKTFTKPLQYSTQSTLQLEITLNCSVMSIYPTVLLLLIWSTITSNYQKYFLTIIGCSYATSNDLPDELENAWSVYQLLLMRFLLYICSFKSSLHRREANLQMKFLIAMGLSVT